jgi:hypothetical protein
MRKRSLTPLATNYPQPCRGGFQTRPVREPPNHEPPYSNVFLNT